MEFKTNWTHATTNPSKALAGLISCLNAGYNAWIEVRENGHQDLPVMKKNPMLDDILNWESYCGTIRSDKHEPIYFNETEKELCLNYVEVTSTVTAYERYKKTGEISKGLIVLACEKPDDDLIRCPIPIVDANRYRKEITGDGYEYGYWMNHWRAKKGIEAYIVDDSVGFVFTICYNTEPVDMGYALRRAAEYLNKFAENYE